RRSLEDHRPAILQGDAIFRREVDVRRQPDTVTHRHHHVPPDGYRVSGWCLRAAARLGMTEHRQRSDTRREYGDDPLAIHRLGPPTATSGSALAARAAGIIMVSSDVANIATTRYAPEYRIRL